MHRRMLRPHLSTGLYQVWMDCLLPSFLFLLLLVFFTSLLPKATGVKNGPLVVISSQAHAWWRSGPCSRFLDKAPPGCPSSPGNQEDIIMSVLAWRSASLLIGHFVQQIVLFFGGGGVAGSESKLFVSSKSHVCSSPRE